MSEVFLWLDITILMRAFFPQINTYIFFMSDILSIMTYAQALNKELPD